MTKTKRYDVLDRAGGERVKPSHTDITEALELVEQAIDAHPDLQRHRWAGFTAEAHCVVDRAGFEIRCDVIPTTRRVRRPTTIGTSGHAFPTPAQAADELIRCLEFWAKAVAK